MKKDQLLIFYDSWYPMCTHVMMVIKKNDRNGRLTFVTFRDPVIMEEYDLYSKKVEERLYSICRAEGKHFSGIASVYEIAKRVPAYWPLLPFLFVSMKVGIGDISYDFIAKRRKIIPVGHCEGEDCAMPTNSRPH